MDIDSQAVQMSKRRLRQMTCFFQFHCFKAAKPETDTEPWYFYHIL